MDNLSIYVKELLTNAGLSAKGATFLTESIMILIILVIAVLGYIISKWFIVKIVHLIARRTKSQWDDILLEKKVFQRLAYLTPALIINYLIGSHHEEIDFLVNAINLIVSLYFVVVIVQVIMSFLRAAN